MNPAFHGSHSLPLSVTLKPDQHSKLHNNLALSFSSSEMDTYTVLYSTESWLTSQHLRQMPLQNSPMQCYTHPNSGFASHPSSNASCHHAKNFSPFFALFNLVLPWKRGDKKIANEKACDSRHCNLLILPPKSPLDDPQTHNVDLKTGRSKRVGVLRRSQGSQGKASGIREQFTRDGLLAAAFQELRCLSSV